jgi:hypothetical protein
VLYKDALPIATGSNVACCILNLDSWLDSDLQGDIDGHVDDGEVPADWEKQLNELARDS